MRAPDEWPAARRVGPVDGEPVAGVADLLRIPGQRQVGDRVRLEVLRGGRQIVLEAVPERGAA